VDDDDVIIGAERIKDRSDAADLVGTAEVTDRNGNRIPFIDDDGNEVLRIATGDDSKKGIAGS
jgi:hypothetical protein